MENNQKLIDSFSVALGIDPSLIIETLKYQGVPEWDSISHMILISQIEEDFDISFDTDDVIDMSSFGKAKDILTKYGVSF